MKKRELEIPKEFHLMGVKWTVKYDDKMMDETGAFGDCSYTGNEIRLSKRSYGRELTDEQVEQIFIHELTHAILYTMSEKDKNKDEKFVDIFSGLFHQFIKQIDFKK